MKKCLIFLLTLMLLTSCSNNAVSSSKQIASVQDGIYVAAARGNNDDIELETVIEDEKITSIKILSHNETPGISNVPLEQLPIDIVNEQSIAVDVYTAATMTSLGIIQAVSDCLEQAGANLNDWKKPVEIDGMTTQNTECDVVVVGSGGAGITAALYAAQSGAKVIIVEKEDIPGGTSLLSQNMFGSVATSIHKAEGKTKTNEDIYQYYLQKEAATGAYAVPEAARILADNCTEAAEYLIGLGIELDHTTTDYILAPKAGKYVGEMVIPTLLHEMESSGAELRTGTRATKIIMENDQAVGIVVENKTGSYEIRAKAVIMATGGYVGNRDLIDEYLPEWKTAIRRYWPGNTGDGILMAQEAGLEVIDLDVAKGTPFMFIDRTAVLSMNPAIKLGAILVNHEGNRFANEEGSYSIAPAVNQQTKSEAIVIFDNTVMEKDTDSQKFFEKGFITEAASLNELAQKLDIDEETLLDTVSNYLAALNNDVPDEFGRKLRTDCLNGTAFYGIVIKPCLQGTFGGIHTNINTEVYNTNNEIVGGMYAVGECAQEGLNGYNPMTVNLVFGKICGKNAAEYALNQ